MEKRSDWTRVEKRLGQVEATRQRLEASLHGGSLTELDRAIAAARTVHLPQDARRGDLVGEASNQCNERHRRFAKTAVLKIIVPKQMRQPPFCHGPDASPRCFESVPRQLAH